MPTHNQTEDSRDFKKIAGLTTSRVQSLGDSIFAFAMTLLVLNFRLPANVSATPNIGHILNGLIPHFVIYALTFLVLGVLWVAHHHQYNWIQRSDRNFLWINIFFFMFVVLLPFSTDLLATYHQYVPSVIFYDLNIIICSSILYLHWSYATNEETVVVTNASDPVVSRIKARMLFTIIVNIVALGIAFISVNSAIAIIILVQIMNIAPAVTIDKIITYRR